MSPDLDLSRRQWTKTRGPITAIGTWLRLDGSFQPCIVLIRAGSERDDRLIPCVVTLSRAYVWDPRTSDDMGEATMTAIQFADTLRLTIDKHTVTRLIMFINDMLGDLLTIPPYRPDDAPTVAEATLINHSTGRTVETEMKDV
jgi:hypothetical protein